MPNAGAKESYAVFGVLDGHRGHAAARLAAKRLPGELTVAVSSADASPMALEDAVTRVFVETDAWLRDSFDQSQKGSGSTCVVAGLGPEKAGKRPCFVANAGDSRGVLVRRGVQTEPVILASGDHKPGQPNERERILQAGGIVSGIDGGDVPRLDGSLAVSRGFGDFDFKQDPSLPPSAQKVSCVPELYLMSLCAGDVIILACDGIFDVMSTEAVVGRVLQGLSPDLDLGDLAAQILQECLATESKDNMTLMIVELGVGGPQDEANEDLRGLEKFYEIQEGSTRRLYRSFLEYCSEGGPLSAEARRVVSQVASEEGEDVDVSAYLAEMVGDFLRPFETPTAALRRYRPLQRQKKRRTEAQHDTTLAAMTPDEAKFNRLTELCDALVTRGFHDIYQNRREELEKLPTSRPALSRHLSALA